MQSKRMYKVDVDPEQALDAVKSGATILLLNVPPGIVVGVDQQAFGVGDKFLGVKMLPPGVHFLSTTSTDSYGGFAPVVGCFMALGSGDVYVRQWDRLEESLCCLDSEDEFRYKEGVKRFDFDHGLAPYDCSSHAQWRSLSKYITKESIERIMPVTGFISIMQEDSQDDLTGATPAERELIDQLGEGLTSENLEKHREVHKCFYVDFPDMRRSKTLVGSELTAIYLDKSEVLTETLETCYANDERNLLAELQFSFLSFVLCQSLQGLKQWKSILQLMLGCEEAFLTLRRELYLKFAKCIRSQLAFGLAREGDVSDSWSKGILEESFLKQCLIEFLERVDKAAEAGAGVDADFYQECQLISKLVEEKLGWKVEQIECGEYAPVVVAL